MRIEILTGRREGQTPCLLKKKKPLFVTYITAILFLAYPSLESWGQCKGSAAPGAQRVKALFKGLKLGQMGTDQA